MILYCVVRLFGQIFQIFVYWRAILIISHICVIKPFALNNYNHYIFFQNKRNFNSVSVLKIFYLFIGEALASLLGGQLFDSYGGVWSFRFFAYCSAFMCFLNILSNRIGLTKDLTNCDFVVVSKIENYQDVVNKN